MGNCPLCDNIISIKIVYENNGVIILNEEKDKVEKFPIIKNIKGNSQDRKFINLIDYIYQNNRHLSDENMSIIKITIKYILESISNNVDNINNHLKVIDDFMKDKYDIEKLKNLINLFIFIYSNKDKIENNKAIYFIESINNVLKETKTLTLEKDITFFINYLKNIFQIKNVENDQEDQANGIENNQEEQDKITENIQKDQIKEIDNSEEESKIKIDKKMTYNETETNFVRKDEELVSNTVIGNNSK